MTYSYQASRSWSDQFLDQVRTLIGKYFLRPAREREDTEEATDLVMLESRQVRIGVRLRRSGYVERYPWDFTIRSRVPSGAETELQKILRGAADLFFYGHVNRAGEIHRWFLLDLDVFRQALKENPRLLREAQSVPNTDGTAGVAFDLRAFPRGLVVAVSPDVEY